MVIEPREVVWPARDADGRTMLEGFLDAYRALAVRGRTAPIQSVTGAPGSTRLVFSVDVLDLGFVTLPDRHPHSADGTCPIQAVAVGHPNGVILFDTGVADDHPLINESYEPTVVPVGDALAGAGADERLRLIDGDEQLADGVWIVATPGHTPGHQSVVVDDGARLEALGGQCCYDGSEFADNDPTVADVHDDSWIPEARRSIERLHAFDPDAVHLAHDRSVWRSIS